MDFIKEFLDNSRDIGKINDTTLEIYRKDIEDFDGFIYGKELLDVDEHDIISYIEELKKRYSEASINRKISSLKSFYKYLLQNRIIDRFPFVDIIVPQSVKNTTMPLEKWEIYNILEMCGDSYEEKRDSLVIRLISETGLKIGDILGLKKTDLQLSDYKSINFYSHSNIIREGISEKLSRDLKEFSEKLDPEKDKIFGNLSRPSFRVRFINYAKKAGIKRKVSPSMIKKMVVEIKLREEGETLLEKIRKEYMRIGIGDD